MDNTGVAEGNGSSLPDISYIDRLEEKLAILKAISETETPSETPNEPPRRIDQTGVKENVWAAFLVATVDELQQFLDFKVRSGKFFVETIETILVGVDFAVANVISIASSKQATPSKRATSKSGVGSGVQSLLGKAKQKTRNQGSIDQTKERDGGKCTLLHTTVKEAVHIYPVAQTKAAAACKTSLYALGFIWGGNTCDKFKDALSIEDFDIPKNMITLGNAPHHLHKKAARQPIEVSLISADTQYRIKYRHLFTVISDDPNLLPSAELLKLRDRIMAMMALMEGADADHHILSSASGGDDAPRILFGDKDVAIDLEDKVLE
ncbi:hypothetical protein K4K57_008447 [Colletotrichum sp. SAR 10_99]|nr:hypothetical protein K4K57_008447 [Colletotrichum sp. SAR 10_99]